MEKKEKIIGSIIMVVICTIFLVVGYILSKPKAYNNDDIFIKNSSSQNQYKDSIIVDKSNGVEKNSNAKEEFKNIIVEIKGEVKNPNVYTMDYGSRVYDLVKKAGGFTAKADELSINCSMKLKDEDCIIIYNKDEKERTPSPYVNNEGNRNESSINSNLSSGKININTASKEELITLPGIGDVTAEKIVDYREKNGVFNSIEDLTKIDRIGEKTLDKFKDKIEVR
ncbi:competence protein [Clostridium bovifaecis]|uniref:Competence protein n=1 Tax=Clostridium bovifaecis TaxID=2184719 RepID=A0A6I6EYZ7_9CLOT|nr:competence protein [Clostridium bovifaecis]